MLVITLAAVGFHVGSPGCRAPSVPRGGRLTSPLAAADRREALTLGAAALGALAPLADTAASAASAGAPVLVLGASGGTGKECVRYLLARGTPTIAATRDGSFDPEIASGLLSVVRGDVTSKVRRVASTWRTRRHRVVNQVVIHQYYCFMNRRRSRCPR